MEPKILLIGCGGIGMAYMHVILRVIPETHLFAVCRSNREAALANGFQLNSEVWGQGLQMRPVIAGSVAEAVEKNNREVFDYIIICTKMLPSSSLAETIRPAVSDKTSIVLFQNGIGIEEPYASAYPSNSIIGAIIYMSSTEVAPAVAVHRAIEELHLGTYPSAASEAHKSAVSRLGDVFIQGGATTTLHDDIQAERWSKALLNTTWGPITALARSGDSEFVASHAEAVKLVKQVMLEVAAVAQAHGYTQINEALVDKQLARTLGRDPPGIKFSMMVDATAGRVMEVDAIVGNVVAAASDKGVSVPTLQSIYLIIKALNISLLSNK